MKNSKSLSGVLCLLILLVCGCSMDMFETKKQAPVSTATPAPTVTPENQTPRPISTPKEEETNDLLKTGTYTGKGENVTYKKRGDFLLRIDSVDASGNVKAYFQASNGLQGTSRMTGKVDDKGKLTLDGTLDDGDAISISATVAGDKISAGYGISDADLNTQAGNFSVVRE
jgi:hypothetical protein